MCKVSLKHVEPNGRDSDLKIASFFSFLKMLPFEIQVCFLQGIIGKILILFLIIIGP